MKAMPFTVFLFLYLIALCGVFAVGYEAGQRWPVVGRIFDEPEGYFLVGIIVSVLLALLLGAIGIEIK